MPVTTQGSSSANPPANLSTPAQYEAWFNANFEGDNQVKGGTVAALSSLGYTGSTLGGQWMTFYGAKHAQFGSQYTLTQYADAFVVLWEDAMLGGNIAAATGATGSIITGDLSGIGKGIAQFNNQAGGVPAAAAGALSGVDAIGNFFNNLGNSNLWYRAGCIVGGLFLLYLGLNRMTGGKIAASVKGTAKAAGTAAIL